MIDKRHGGPWDRGNADSYYRRGINPHYFKGASYSSQLVEEPDMTDEELAEYLAGYNKNEEMQNFKDWG